MTPGAFIRQNNLNGTFVGKTLFGRWLTMLRHKGVRFSTASDVQNRIPCSDDFLFRSYSHSATRNAVRKNAHHLAPELRRLLRTCDYGCQLKPSYSSRSMLT
jgi:hypothetical protein